MPYQAIITGPCVHDGMRFDLEIDDTPDWPAEVGLLDADGDEIIYPRLRTEPVPFEMGQHDRILLTAYYGPGPNEEGEEVP